VSQSADRSADRPAGDAEPTGPTVLLVEDDAAHAHIVRRAFESHGRGAELFTVASLAEARRFLEHTSPTVAIVDLHLPDGNGMDLLASGAAGRFPVVVMTSHGGEQVAVEVMKSGAVDYVVKDDATVSEWSE